MKERSVVLAVVLSLVTFGFYNVWWLSRVWMETAEVQGKPHQARGAFAAGITVWALTLVTLGYFFSQWIIVLRNAFGNEPATGPPVGYFVATGLLMLLGAAQLAVTLWLMWNAASGIGAVRESRGLPVAIPPVVHVIIPIFFGLWTTIAIGILTHDQNEAIRRA